MTRVQTEWVELAKTWSHWETLNAWHESLMNNSICGQWQKMGHGGLQGWRNNIKLKWGACLWKSEIFQLILKSNKIFFILSLKTNPSINEMHNYLLSTKSKLKFVPSLEILTTNTAWQKTTTWKIMKLKLGISVCST